MRKQSDLIAKEIKKRLRKARFLLDEAYLEHGETGELFLWCKCRHEVLQELDWFVEDVR